MTKPEISRETGAERLRIPAEMRIASTETSIAATIKRSAFCCIVAKKTQLLKKHACDILSEVKWQKGCLVQGKGGLNSET